MCTRSDSLARSTRSRCIFVTTTRHGNECHTRFYAPRVCESSCLAHARLRRRLRSRCTGIFLVSFIVCSLDSRLKRLNQDSTCTLQWTRQCIRNNLTAK